MWQHSDRIRRAIQALPTGQYRQLLIRHTCQKEVGSYDCSADQLDALIFSSDWAAYGCPNLLPGRAYFRAEIAGRCGYLDIQYKAKGYTLFLVRRHNAQQWELHTNAGTQIAAFSVMTLGKDGGVEVLIDLHPGDPTKPVEIAQAALMGTPVGAELIRKREETEQGHRIQLTAQQARGLGLRWAKTR